LTLLNFDVPQPAARVADIWVADIWVADIWIAGGRVNDAVVGMLMRRKIEFV